MARTRSQHLAVVERAIQNAVSRQRDKLSGQKSLFGGDDTPTAKQAAPLSLPDVPELTQSQTLAAEKEVLGFYLTSHPLTEFADKLQLYSTHVSSDLVSLGDKAEVRLGGMISAIKKATTKKPSRNGHTRYANFDFEDVKGTVRCIMWPEDYARLGEMVKAEQICFIEGRVDRRGREPNLVVNELMTLEQADRKFTDRVAVKFKRGLHSEEDIVRVRDILRRHPGRCDVALVVETFDEQNPTLRQRVILAPSAEVKVAAEATLAKELQEVLGQDNVQFTTTQKARGEQREERTQSVLSGSDLSV